MLEFKGGDTDAIAKFLKSGGVLAYPSESVWGIGCDAFNHQALAQVLTLKSRTPDKGLIVLTDHIDKLQPLFEPLTKDDKQKIITALTQSKIKENQATTWLLPITKGLNLPPLLTGQFDKLAVRITPHPVLQSICQAISDKNNPYGFLVSTSCNPSGQDPANDLAVAQGYFGERVGYVVADSLGFDKPSQIIDPLTGELLR